MSTLNAIQKQNRSNLPAKIYCQFMIDNFIVDDIQTSEIHQDTDSCGATEVPHRLISTVRSTFQRSFSPSYCEEASVTLRQFVTPLTVSEGEPDQPS